MVVDFTAAVQVRAGVEEQPHIQAGTHQAVGQVKVSEVIAGLILTTIILT